METGRFVTLSSQVLRTYSRDGLAALLVKLSGKPSLFPFAKDATGEHLWNSRRAESDEVLVSRMEGLLGFQFLPPLSLTLAI